MGLILNRQINILPIVLFMLVYCISAVGVTDESAKENGSADVTKESSSTDIVWPARPQEPKIRYIRSIATSEDMAVEEGFFSKILEFIIGSDGVIDVVKPMGLAVNSVGKLFVAGPAGKRIHIFDISGQDYSSIEEVDGGFRKIFKFNREGDYITAFGDELLQRPTGIAIDSEKKLLYVVDTPVHNVKAYSLESGEVVAVLGERGTEDGTFNFPSYAALDAKGALYITDAMNKKVQVFGADREYQRAVGKPGDGSGSFSARC